MSEIARDVAIVNAPARTIMSILADVENYPAWYHELSSAVPLSLDSRGRPETVRISFGTTLVSGTCDLGYRWERDRLLRWELLAGDRFRELTGSCTLLGRGARRQVVAEMEMDIDAPLLPFIKRRLVRAAVAGLVRSIKIRAEGEASLGSAK